MSSFLRDELVASGTGRGHCPAGNYVNPDFASLQGFSCNDAISCSHAIREALSEAPTLQHPNNRDYNPAMAVTLKDVALEAGVSIRTVSNVVNGYTRVSPALRQQVETAVARTGYSPNTLARSLKQGRSRLIALILPELNNPYFAELTHHFVAVAKEFDYTVMIDSLDGNRANERAAITRNGTNALFDGLIVSPLGLGSDDLAALSPIGPMVLLGEENHPLMDHVLIDNEAAAHAATLHLITNGYTRIAAIGAEESSLSHGTSQLRYQGFMRALRENNLAEASPGVASVVSFDRPSGVHGMRSLLELDGVPDAVFCFSDVLAFGAMHAIASAGLKVPDDIAVMGFDDTEESLYSMVPISTVSPDQEWIARTALGFCLDRVSGDTTPPRIAMGPWRIIERASTRRRSV